MFSNLEQLKNTVRIEDIVGKYVKLKKSSTGYVGLCPFHNEKTPSFNTRKDKNSFKCFGCGKGGNAIDFVSLHDNLGFVDAVKRVAELSNFTLEEDSKEILKPIHRLEKLSKEFLENFENVRKISNNTLLRFGVTEGLEWMPKAKKEIKVVCFNYLRNGELINIKFRGKNKDMKLAKDAELIFYNLDAIQETEDCVIVEGEVDCLSLYEAGIYNCVSVPNGANSNLKYIDNCYEYFINKKKIIIATDNDEAGRKLRDELMFRFGVDRCYMVDFPEDCKDSNDVLVKHGKDVLKRVIENATQIPIEGLTAYNERKNRLLDLYENGIPSGTPCGIYGFDEYLRFQGGLVTMITAPPSSGKSEFLDYIISSLAVRENWRFGVFSFENQPIELHDAKLAEKIIGKAFGFRKDRNNRIDKESLNLVIDELHDKFKIIDTSKVDISLDGVLSKSEEMVNKYGIKGLVIDPYNKILHSVPNGMTETNYVNFFMTKITSFAKRFNVHVFLVVHPTKPQNTSVSTDGKPQRVTLYSASGSANFYNQTDNGFVLLRDRETGIVDVHIEKVRFNEQGREGWVSFTFDTMTRQYIFAGSKHPIQPQEQPQPQYITPTTPMFEFDDQPPF
jgi:twinkle protein